MAEWLYNISSIVCIEHHIHKNMQGNMKSQGVSHKKVVIFSFLWGSKKILQPHVHTLIPYQDSHHQCQESSSNYIGKKEDMVMLFMHVSPFYGAWKKLLLRREKDLHSWDAFKAEISSSR